MRLSPVTLVSAALDPLPMLKSNKPGRHSLSLPVYEAPCARKSWLERTSKAVGQDWQKVKGVTTCLGYERAAPAGIDSVVTRSPEKQGLCR